LGQSLRRSQRRPRTSNQPSGASTGKTALGGKSTDYYQLVAAVAGVIGGVLLTEGPEVSVAAMVGGAVGEVGAMTVVTWHLSAVQETNTLMIVMVAGVGALPGFLVGQLVAPIEARIRGR